jgi:hypothetical protein
MNFLIVLLCSLGLTIYLVLVTYLLSNKNSFRKFINSAYNVNPVPPTIDWGTVTLNNQHTFGSIPPYVPDFPKYGTFNAPNLPDPVFLDNTQPQLWLVNNNLYTNELLYIVYPNNIVEVYIEFDWNYSICDAEEIRDKGTFISYV